MARLKIKSPGKKLQIKAHLSFGEHWNPKERETLESTPPVGLMRLEMVNGRSAFYSAPADMTLERYLDGGLDRVTFFRMIMQIVNVLRQIEHLHLKFANLEMDPKWIFLNCHSRDLFFLYQPLEMPGDPVSPHKLLNLLANAASGYDTEAKAIDELRRLTAMTSVIQNNDLEALVVKYMPELQSGFLYSTRKNKQQRRNGTMLMEDYEEEYGFGSGTVVMDEEDPSDPGATTVIDDEPVYEPVNVGVLRRLRTGESVRIEGDVFRLGRSHASSDYCIEDNTAVGRAHAEIITRGGRFYICDSNSKNGTYLNGTRLVPMQETEMLSGSELRLANEDFEFQIIQE